MSDLDKRKSQLCLKCLKCCNYIAVRADFAYGDPHSMEFYTTRGCAVVEAKGGGALVVFKSPCQHLTQKGCAIYESRPDACRAYDGRLDPVVESMCRWHEISEEEELEDAFIKLGDELRRRREPPLIVIPNLH